MFNVRDRQGRLLCPACGWTDYARAPAYGESGGMIGSAICPCCLWEPGFDDDPRASAAARNTILASLRAYRDEWASQLVWRGHEDLRPPLWDAAAQLAHLLELAHHLR